MGKPAQFVPQVSQCSKRSRPDRANPPAVASCAPGQLVVVKEPPVRGRTNPSGSSCAPLADAEKEPPVRVEPACGSSACPGQPVQKRGAARPESNPPAAVRVPWSPCAEKSTRRIALTVTKVCNFYSNRSSVSTSLRAPAPARVL